MIVQIERGENLHAFQAIDDYTVFAWNDTIFMKMPAVGKFNAVAVVLATGAIEGMPGLRLVRPVTKLVASFN